MADDRDGDGYLWTFPTIKVYYDQRISDLRDNLTQRIDGVEKAIKVAMAAADKATDKAEQAQAQRNLAANEFRDSLSDLSGLMWTTKEGTAAIESLRREIAIKLDAHDQKMNTLSSVVSASGGASRGISSSVTTAMAGLSIIISLVIGIMLIVRTVPPPSAPASAGYGYPATPR